MAVSRLGDFAAGSPKESQEMQLEPQPERPEGAGTVSLISMRPGIAHCVGEWRMCLEVCSGAIWQLLRYSSTATRVVLLTKGSLSYLSSPCFSKNVLQSGVGIVH